MLAEFLNEILVASAGVAVLLCLWWLWNRVRMRPQKIISPHPSVTNQNGGELVFMNDIKIKKINSLPVKEYRLGFSNSGTIILPEGTHTVIFDYEHKSYSEDKSHDIIIKDGNVIAIIEAGKKYVLKLMIDAAAKRSYPSLVPIDNNRDLKKYLGGLGSNEFIYEHDFLKIIASGDSFVLQKKYDKAIAAYSKALKMYSGAIYYNKRGYAYIGKCDYGKAIKDFNMAIMFKPNDAVLYYNRGFAYSSTGHIADARADFNRALSLNPMLEDARKALNELEAKLKQ